MGFTFNEISYAPEIVNVMLKRQQAGALLAARKAIVRGAVDITEGAMNALAGQGIALSENKRAQVAGGLLATICSETGVRIVLPLEK